MDNLSPEQRRRTMQAIKSKGTKEEVRMAKTLWNLGYRYRKNNKAIYGKPDLTFKKYKIAVFIDGEFFHGKDWESWKNRIGTNNEYWTKKIKRNIERDIEVNTHLESKGWKVLRFWSRNVKKDLESCIKIIVNEIETSRQG